MEMVSSCQLPRHCRQGVALRSPSPFLPLRLRSRAKRGCSGRGVHPPPLEVFQEALMFDGVAIRGSFLRDWDEWVERNPSGGQPHPESEFLDFVGVCRFLSDLLQPWPLLLLPAPPLLTCTPSASEVRSSLRVAGFPFLCQPCEGVVLTFACCIAGPSWLFLVATRLSLCR